MCRRTIEKLKRQARFTVFHLTVATQNHFPDMHGPTGVIDILHTTSQGRLDKRQILETKLSFTFGAVYRERQATVPLGMSHH